MTSKNSFFRNILEDLKRRIWLIAMVGAMFFFLLPIRSIFMLAEASQRAADYGVDLKTEVGYRVWTIYGLSNVFSVFVIAIAILIGLQSFSYLFDRRKVDLYHSVPVSSNKRFWIQYLGGIFVFAGTYLVNALLSFIVWITQGIWNVNGLGTAFAGIGMQFLLFICIYNVVVIAALLSGNIAVSVAAAGVLLGYEYIIRVGISTLCQIFFETYNYPDTSSRLWTVPFIKVFETLNIIHIDNNSGMFCGQTGLLAGNLIYLFVYFAITLGIGYVLYRIRPSEAAGRSISFGKSKGIIKLFLLVPFAVVFAIIFYTSSYYKIYMANIGLILGLIIGQVVVEAIMEQDIKAAFKRKIYMAGAFVIALGTMLSFEYDFIGFDSYVPKESKIESAAIMLSNTPDYYSRVINANGTYISKADYYKENMKLTDSELIVTAGKYMMEHYEERTGEGTINAILVYRLKNGKEVSRRAMFNPYDNEELMEQILLADGYKETVYRLDLDQKTLADNNITAYYCNFDTTTKIGLDFLDVYRKDMENFGVKELLYEAPIGQIVLENKSGANIAEYPVYDSFINVEKYLEEYGIEYRLEKIFTENIDYYEYVEIYQYKEDGEKMKIYDDKEEILQILNASYDSSYSEINVDEIVGADFEVNLYSKGGYCNSFRIYKEKMPEFLKGKME